MFKVDKKWISRAAFTRNWWNCHAMKILSTKNLFFLLQILRETVVRPEFEAKSWLHAAKLTSKRDWSESWGEEEFRKTTRQKRKPYKTLNYYRRAGWWFCFCGFTAFNERLLNTEIERKKNDDKRTQTMQWMGWLVKQRTGE